MKKALYILVFLVAIQASAQKYFTRTGTTEFKASVVTFEPVEAINKSTSAILKVDSGEIAALLFINAFQFKVALMQEHFNENYMDSDRHPKATFKGKIVNFSISNFSEKATYKIKGVLTIRGIKKNIETLGKLFKKGNKIYLKTNFSVKPQDFDIKIPKIVRKNIAKNITIHIDYELTKKQ